MLFLLKIKLALLGGSTAPRGAKLFVLPSCDRSDKCLSADVYISKWEARGG
jgi:hypothetical protein